MLLCNKFGRIYVIFQISNLMFFLSNSKGCFLNVITILCSHLLAALEIKKNRIYTIIATEILKRCAILLFRQK